MPSPSPARSRRAFLTTGAASVAGLSGLAGCRSLLGPRQRLWSVEFDGTPTPPVVAEGTVHVGTREGDAGRLHALDSGSGERAWSAEIDGAPLSEHRPVGRDGVVVVCSRAAVVGVDAETGDRRWTVSTDGETASVAANGEGFYVASDQGVLALDTDGETRWRRSPSPPVRGPLAAGPVGVFGTEWADGDAVGVAGLDPATGESRWRSPVEGSRLAGLSAAGDRVFVAGDRLTARDATAGTVDWAFDPGSRERLSTPPLTTENRVFVGTGVPWTDRSYGTVFELGRRNGTVGYEYRTDEGVSALAGDDDGLFALVGRGRVHAVDPDAMSGRWRLDLGGRHLAARGGTCYVTRRESSRLVALDGRT